MDGVFELQAEHTVMSHCRQLLSANSDPSYVSQYIQHSLPAHRQFLCAGAWMSMDFERPDSISIANLVSCHSIITFNLLNCFSRLKRQISFDFDFPCSDHGLISPIDHLSKLIVREVKHGFCCYIVDLPW